MSDPLERHPHLRVVRRLAVGGMGEVLLTRFNGNGHVSAGLVVVKRTIPEHPHRAHQDELLREEGRVALRLRHANLVDTYSLDEVAGHPLLVMEYLAGRSMAQVLGAAKRKQQPVPVPVALSVLYGAACGLHFAHTLAEGDTPLGLVHRDVSPANIFATFDGKVKVIDFGVAKADDSEIKTSTGILKGKLGYMSPEHAKGEKLDPRADLWSLGVVFWEMLVADRLYGGQNPAMTLFQITQGPLESPRVRRPDLPPEVEALCLRLLTKDREQRIASGAELVRAIEGLPPALWRDADVGGFLAERFPAEAEVGRREVAEAARRVHARVVPSGLVDGGAAGEDSGEVATVVVDGSSLVAAAMAAGSAARVPTPLPLPSGGTRPIPPMTSDPFAPGAIPTPPRTPIPAAIPAAVPAAVPTPPHTRIPPAVSTPPHTPIPTPVSTPISASPATPIASLVSPQAAPAPTMAPTAPLDLSALRSQLGERPERKRAPSAAAVALSTFGALAIVMGIAFALLAQQRDAPPTFIGYPSPDGSDVVVARLADVPADAGQPFQVTLAAAHLAVEPGAGRHAIAAGPLTRELQKAGVWQLALQPKTPKQRVALALPGAITLLGLLSLAFALPGLLLPSGTRQLAIRTAGMLGVLALGAFLLRSGGLGWPGLPALEEPEEAPRLTFSAAPPRLGAAKLSPEDEATLTKALLTARAAILRGQPQAAVSTLAPVTELAPDLPALYAALGDAHRDLDKPSLAEGHYLRYLELWPDAPDRDEVSTYLTEVQRASAR